MFFARAIARPQLDSIVDEVISDFFSKVMRSAREVIVWYVPNVSIISACSMLMLCDIAMCLLHFYTFFNIFGLTY